MKTNFKVSGLAEARDLLRRLPERVQKRVQRQAVRAAATTMRGEIRKAAPRGKEPSKASKQYGPLHRNIRIIRLRRVPPGADAFRVDTGNAFWSVLYEFGTSRQPPRAWFRPAVDTAAEAALNRMREQLAKGIEREASALAGSYSSARSRLR
jgi:HK97 gp10 family phage protein